MEHASTQPGARGFELLLEHCAAITRTTSLRTPAFERLEHELGGELSRLLVVALVRRRSARVTV